MSRRTPVYKTEAKNTKNYGSWSIIKAVKDDPSSILYISRGLIKFEYLGELGLLLSDVWEAKIRSDWRDTQYGYAAYVKRLLEPTSFELREYRAERTKFRKQTELTEYDGMVRSLVDLKQADYPILWPAIKFTLANFELKDKLDEDMHDGNVLVDPHTHKLIAYDVFNWEYMLQMKHGDLLKRRDNDV